MEVPIGRYNKTKFSSVDQAVKDLNLGREFFTRKSSDMLVKIDTPELIKRYFYDLWTHK
jgi:hypothetical protein